jgi:hypothetical protein
VAKGIDFQSFVVKEPTFEDVLPRSAFEERLRKAAAFTSKGSINISVLVQLFGLTPAQIAAFSAAVGAALAQHPGGRPNVEACLAPFRDALARRYDAALARGIDWWITADPSRQYTASLDPRMEEPATWYGAAYATGPTPPSSADERHESLMAGWEGRLSGAEDSRPVYDGDCPLCRTPVVRGGANSVVLTCGHSFHWTTTAEGDCTGLRSWAADHDTCPTCRTVFAVDSDEEEVHSQDTGSIPVVVDWPAA